jgi:hypothetical protein
MPTEFHGQVMGGELRLQSGQSELRQQLLASMEGKRVIETIRREGKSKSWPQVKCHWALAVERVRQAMIDKGWSICGVAPNKDMVHDILTKACGGVGELGEVVRLSEMTPANASQYFENIRDWAATQLNLVIPDPDPNWRERPEQGAIR